MENTTDLQDWELLSDSETTPFHFDEAIIHFNYFSLDSTNPSNLQGIEPTSENFDELGVEEIAHDAKGDVGFEVSEPGHLNSDVGSCKGEVFIEEINKGELGFDLPAEMSSKGDAYRELGVEEITNDAKLDVGFEVSGSGHQDSDVGSCTDEVFIEESNKRELGSDLCAEMCEGEKKVKVLEWWKMPLDILRMCVLRARPVWSIPIAAAFIGILMVGRRLYKMKHKSRRVALSLKVRFDDKKATSQQLVVRTARLNEIMVRRAPVIRSPPMLTAAGGVTPWPLLGLL